MDITGSAKVKAKTTDDYYLELTTDAAKLSGGGSALSLSAAQAALSGSSVKASASAANYISLSEDTLTAAAANTEITGTDHISLKSATINTSASSTVKAATSLALQAPSVSVTTGDGAKAISLTSEAGTISHPVLSISGGGASGSRFEVASYASATVLGTSVTAVGSKAASPTVAASAKTYVTGSTVYLGPKIQIDSDGSITFGVGTANSSRIKIDSEGYLWIGDYKMTIGD